MKKKFIPIALAALLVPSAVLAQDTKGVVRTPAEARLVYPLLSQQMRLKVRTPQLPSASRFIAKAPEVTDPLKAGKAAQFWCNLIYKAGWNETTYGPYGYYTMTAQKPVAFSVLASTGETINVATNGVQAKNGHLYGAYLNMQYVDEGYVFLYLSNTDLSTGETSSFDAGMDYLYLAATETAQAADGTVYGVFYSADGNSLEWGTVDYETCQRTTIGPASQAFVAIGITKAGQLYAIGMDGKLYKVNKSTGEETLVGATGLTLTNLMGQYYGQSGEIDQRDDTFYWYCIDNQAQGGLYTVDLNTGKATLLDGTLAQVQGMVMAQPEANDGAPERADNLAVEGVTCDPSADGATATISFTIPNTTYAGDILHGDVRYKVMSNRPTATFTPSAEGTSRPGQDVSVKVKTTENELYTFSVVLSNADGDSPKENVSHWMGWDIPLAPTNVKAVADGYKAKVSWTAPTTTLHAGPMGDLTYDLERIVGRDTTVVATGLTATNYTDDLGAGTLHSYVYSVRAVAKGMRSQSADAKAVIIGDAIEPNWETDFYTRSEFDIFSANDVNGDGVTWGYFNAGGIRMVIGPYNNESGNDDWLFTPPVHLKPGRVYNVRMKARNYLAPEYVNTFEVKYGQTASPEGMTGTLMESNVIANDPDRVYNMEINPDKDGNFYIGFHDNTEKAGSGRIVIDFVGIDNGAALDAPDSVSNFTVTPAGLGKLSADLAFTAPTKAINGTPLSRIGYFVIKRDGKSVMWIGNANTVFGEPGKEYTWTDKNIDKSGWHEYEVIAYSEDGYEPGRVARMRVFVGADVAKTPVVNLTDAVNDIKASWNKIGNVGANNGYVDPDHVSVSIYEILETPDGPILGDSMTTSQPGATDVLVGWHPDKSVADDGVSQGLFQVAALTRSDGGNGALEASRAIVVGKPINQPFKETFEGGSVQNNFAWTESNEQHASRRNSSPWMISGKASSNDDGGGVVWSPYTIPDPEFPEYYNVEAGDETSFNLPKVALNGVDQPVVRFNLYSENGEQSDLTVVVQTPDGVNHDVKTFKLSEKKTSGWETLTVDLTPYTNERYIIVKFRGTAHANYTYLMLDQIDIYDASDPEAGISAAELLKEGAQDVWTIDGRIARRNATSLEGLPKGVYMVGGRKVVVK